METIEKDIDNSVYLRLITKNILDQIFQNVEWRQGDGPEILDVGCGPGVVTKEILMPNLPENFKKLIGVDKRDDYITYANNTYKDEKVMFDAMNIKDTPPEYEERFDLVASFLCFQLVQHQEVTLAMAKCVKPGGHLILTFELRTEYEDLICEMSQNWKWAKYMDDNMLPTKERDTLEEETTSIIRGCGFEIVHEEQKRYEVLFRRLDYFNYLKSIDLFSMKMEDEDREEYFSYIEENYVNRNLSPENPETYISKHTLMIVHAIKV